MKRILSIDPGQKKCGVLQADMEDLVVISGKIVKSSSLIALINSWNETNPFDLILLGNGTTSKYWESELLANQLSQVKLVDETSTTLRARWRYMELCPPKFILKWLPKTLLLPPENLDAVVALILIEDYFDKKLYWPPPIQFKIEP